VAMFNVLSRGTLLQSYIFGLDGPVGFIRPASGRLSNRSLYTVLHLAVGARTRGPQRWRSALMTSTPS